MDNCFLLRVNSTAQGQIQATSDEALCVGPAAAQWLRRCATSRNVPGSIPRRGIFFSEASDKCPGSTQPLKMSTRIFLGMKAAGA